MVERKFAVYRWRLRPRSSTAAQAARLNGVEMATAAATAAGTRSPCSPSHLRRTLPPERDAHEAQGHLRTAREQQPDHELEVFRVARVVEATRAIHLPAAGAEVDDQATPAHLLEAAEQPHDIVRACRAFEAVEHDDERSAGLTPGQPVEIEEVAVRRLDPLTPERRSPKAPQEGSPQGLEMLASVPPRRMIGGGSDHVAAGASTRPPRFSPSAVAHPARVGAPQVTPGPGGRA